MEMTQIAPVNFAITIENPKETLEYFNEVINIIEQNNYFIRFDYTKVKKICGCSVIYLASLIHSLQENNNKNPRCKKPSRENNVTAMLKETGCLVPNGFTTPTVKNNQDSSMMICMGKDFEQNQLIHIMEHMERIWDIAHDKVSFLYEFIGELMQNTEDYAYKHNWDLKHILQKWYLYIKLERDTKKVKFFFLDNGNGIPATVKKSGTDKLIDKLLEYKNRIFKSHKPVSHEGEYIYSALQGRRNNEKIGSTEGGLKIVSDHHSEGRISTLEVYSNSGYCKLSKANEVIVSIKKTLPLHLQGTLFCWEMAI